MKQIFLFTCLLAWITPMLLQGQILSAEQQQILKGLTSEPQRVDMLNEWAYQARGETTRVYATEALKRAQKIGYKKGIGDSYMYLGYAAQDLNNYEEAVRNFTRAAEIRLQIKEPGLAGGSYIALGNYQKRQLKYDEALNSLQKAALLLKKLPPHINTAYLYNSLGTLFQAVANFDSASYYFQQGLAYYEKLKTIQGIDKKDIIKGRANIRMNYAAFLQDNMLEYSTAKDSLRKSLGDFEGIKDTVNIGKSYLLLGNNAYYIGKYTMALENYDKALSLDNIEKSDKFKLIKNKGRVFLDQQKYPEALMSFQISLDSFNTIKNNTGDIAEVQFELGNYYYELDNYEKAISCYSKAIDSIQQKWLKILALDYLSDIYFLAENPEKTDFCIEGYSQILSELPRNSVKSMVRYLGEKNKALKKINLEKTKVVKSQLKIAVVGVLAGVFAAFTGFFRAKNNKKKLEISEKEAEIARKNEEIAINERLAAVQKAEWDIHYARLEAQDKKQQEIGQELHDSIGAKLTAIKFNFATVDEVLDVLPAENRKRYKTANDLLNETYEEVRRISHELGSAVLKKFGLNAQLEAYKEAIQDSGKMQVELATHGLDNRLDFQTELNIFRIVQELVTNTIKHANAQNLSIQVNRFENELNIMVEDDGRGFDLKEVEKKNSLGFQNLRTRVYDLHGTINIDSQPGRGSIFTIDIPRIDKTNHS